MHRTDWCSFGCGACQSRIVGARSLFLTSRGRQVVWKRHDGLSGSCRHDYLAAQTFSHTSHQTCNGPSWPSLLPEKKVGKQEWVLTCW